MTWQSRGKVSYDDLSETQQKYLKNNSVAGQFAFTTSLINATLDKSDIKSILGNIDDAINEATVKSGASLKIYNQKFAENLASGKDKVKGLIEDLQNKINDLKKVQPTLLTPAAITANVAQIKKLQDEIDKLLGKEKKKRGEDAEKLIEDFRKKSIEALAKYSQDELTLLKTLYKDEADDQYKSLDERQAALKKYYDVSNQLIQNDIDAQEAALTIELQIADKKASKIKDSKKRAEALAAIEQYGVDKIKEIIGNGDTKIAALNEEMYKGNVTIAQQSFDKIQKLAEEHYKFMAEQSKIAAQNVLDEIDIKKDDDILYLQKKLKARLITQEEYEKKSTEIEKQALAEQEKIELKRLQLGEIITEALYGVKNYNLIKKAKDLEVKINSDANDKITKKEKETIETIEKYASESKDFLVSLYDDIAEAQSNKIQDQLDGIDKVSQREIDAINNSTLAQEEKQRRIQAIEKQTAFQKDQLEQRQRQIDLQRARFEKAAAITQIVIQTVLEVIKAGGLLSPKGIEIAAEGSAALALAIAQPLPRFKEGTKNAPRGKALVSEEGSELLIDKHGKMFLTPNQPTLLDLAGGERILKHDITMDLLRANNMMNILAQFRNKKQPQRMENGVSQKMIDILYRIERKAPFVINVSPGFETTDSFKKGFKP